MIKEHYFGNLVTNTTHTQSPIILFRAFAEVYDILFGLDFEAVRTTGNVMADRASKDASYYSNSKTVQSMR